MTGQAPVIRLLDPGTVNKIAAGEVVERPASVVKELVENAIDAAAGTVRIEIRSTAQEITSIRVTDDGTGMGPDDAVMAFAPHATSKIRSIADLETVRTLGFRGEALASIAAVSKVTLITRGRGSDLSGSRIVVEGGRVTGQAETGSPEGTNVLVEDLFYNTPARKKFLKSRNTELAHILAVMEGISLSSPGIAFFLAHNGRRQLATERTGTVIDTIARVYGSGLVKRLVPVSFTAPVVRIEGYIAMPELSRKDTARIRIAVNSRPVASSPPLIAAIRAGYGTLLPKERYPVAFIDLEIDTTAVDINVHPAKRQVWLLHEPEITAAVTMAVRDTLLEKDLIPPVSRPDQPIPVLPAPAAAPAGTRYDLRPVSPPVLSEPTHTGTQMTDRQLRQTELFFETLPERTALPQMEVIGQFGGIYIITTTPEGELIIIDQHAAHERILYEIVSAKSYGAPRIQELIVPVILHRTSRDAAILRELIPELEIEGFIIEEFGHDTFLVRAIPVVLGKLEDTGLIDDIVSDLVGPGLSSSADNRERITRTITCRGAIKAGTVCTLEQCRRIVSQIRFIKNPFTCPHGRPTMVRFSRADLDAMFKRT